MLQRGGKQRLLHATRAGSQLGVDANAAISSDQGPLVGELLPVGEEKRLLGMG